MDMLDKAACSGADIARDSKDVGSVLGTLDIWDAFVRDFSVTRAKLKRPSTSS